jgi:hypothetical protein
VQRQLGTTSANRILLSPRRQVRQQRKPLEAVPPPMRTAIPSGRICQTATVAIECACHDPVNLVNQACARNLDPESDPALKMSRGVAGRCGLLLLSERRAKESGRIRANWVCYLGSVITVSPARAGLSLLVLAPSGHTTHDSKITRKLYWTAARLACDSGIIRTYR